MYCRLISRLVQYLHAVLPGKLGILWRQTGLDFVLARDPELRCAGSPVSGLSQSWRNGQGVNPVKKWYEAACCERMLRVDGGNVFHKGQDIDNISASKQSKPRKPSTITKYRGGSALGRPLYISIYLEAQVRAH